MTNSRPPILTALVWTYLDVYHVLRTAWRSGLVALTIVIAGAFALVGGPLLVTYDPVGQAIMRLFIMVGLCALLTPFLLAQLRLTLLGEPPPLYAFEPRNPRFQLFFGWLAVSAVILSAPSFLLVLMTPNGPEYYSGAGPIDAPTPLLIHATRLAAWMLIMRLGILLPAVAIDAPGATWQNAFDDSRRHGWYIPVVTFVALIPFGLLGAAAPSLRSLGGPLLLRAFVDVGLRAAGFLLLVVIPMLIAARLYQAVGAKLNEPSHV